MTQGTSLYVAITGHVDHGKSTLIGRLFYDTDSLPEEKLEEIRKISLETGEEMQFAFIMDHLEEERGRGITIDTAHTFFSTEKRQYVIIDTPGHKEFLKNMFTGSSHAEAAILIIDALEGVMDQTRRHCHILGLIGIKQLIVVVNKMDLIGYDKEKFDKIVIEITDLLESLSIRQNYNIPISAKEGVNVATKSEEPRWYNGPDVLQALDSFNELEVEEKDLRFPIQDVYELDGKPLAVGRVESGGMKKGQEVSILPSGKRSKILSIEKYPDRNIDFAEIEECVGINLDKSVSRGDLLTPPEESRTLTPGIVKTIRTNIFWIDSNPYNLGEEIIFRSTTQETVGKITKIYKAYDPADAEEVWENAEVIGDSQVAESLIELDKPIVTDSFNEIPEMGRFVLEREGYPVAGGIIL